MSGKLDTVENEADSFQSQESHSLEGISNKEMSNYNTVLGAMKGEIQAALGVSW